MSSVGTVDDPTPEVGPEPSPDRDSRVGGSDPEPERGKPGWVWWVTVAFVALLGAGGFRWWRSSRQ